MFSLNVSVCLFLSFQRVFAPVICSSALSSSSHHTPHGRSVSLSSYPSSKRYDEGRSGGGGFSDHRRKERGEGESKDTFGGEGGGGGGGVQATSLSFSSGHSVISTTSSVGSLGVNPLMGIGAVRVASMVVTNVMRPVISPPLPIASRPRDGGTSSPHPPERKSLTPHQQPHLLIGSGGGIPATGGGYYSSSHNPLGGGVGPGGVVTNLMLGGALSAQPAVQLITPSHHHHHHPSQQQAFSSSAVSVPHSQTNGPLPLSLLQPQFLPASSLASPGGKGITQVQYILPTLPGNANPKSPPQQLSQPTSIFNLPTAPPTHMSLANGRQQMTSSLTGYSSSSAVGLVSPGTRGESLRTAIITVSKYSHVVTSNKMPTLPLCPSLPQCTHSLQCSRAKCLFRWQHYGQHQPSRFPLLLRLFRSRTVLRWEARSVRSSVETLT